MMIGQGLKKSAVLPVLTKTRQEFMPHLSDTLTLKKDRNIVRSDARIKWFWCDIITGWVVVRLSGERDDRLHREGSVRRVWFPKRNMKPWEMSREHAGEVCVPFWVWGCRRQTRWRRLLWGSVSLSAGGLWVTRTGVAEMWSAYGLPAEPRPHYSNPTHTRTHLFLNTT